MAIFNVISESVDLDVSGVGANDVPFNGVLTDGVTGVVRATTTGGAVFCQGLQMSNLGQVLYYDATGGLPVGATWNNGLPFFGAALCISTGPSSVYCNGLPMSSNGAVSATLISNLFAAGILQPAGILLNTTILGVP